CSGAVTNRVAGRGLVSVLLFRDQLFALNMVLRTYSKAAPWNTCEPLLVRTRICPPDDRPYSAAKSAVRIWISCVESTSAVPILVPFERVRMPGAPSIV